MSRATTSIPKCHEILGARIILRTTVAEDYSQLGKILNDKESMAALIPYFKKDIWTAEMVEERYESFLKDQHASAALCYSVILKTTGKIVGNCGFNSISLPAKTAEFGIILSKSVWGSGVAAECHLLCLKYGFEELGLYQISFVTDELNARMQDFFARIGIVCMKKESDGSLIYELTKEKWSEVRTKLMNR